MFCPKCGKQISDRAVFCGFCGAQLSPQKPGKVTPQDSGGKTKTPSRKSNSKIGIIIAVCFLLVVGFLLGYNPTSPEPVEQESSGFEEPQTEELSATEIAERRAFETFKLHYLSYIDAINAYDSLLLTHCTSEMKQYAGYKIANFNKNHTYENIGIWVDLDTIVWTQTDFGMQIEFFARCENLCFKRDTGEQVNNNVANQHVVVYYYEDSGEWLVQDAVVKKEYADSIGTNLLCLTEE